MQELGAKPWQWGQMHCPCNGTGQAGGACRAASSGSEGRARPRPAGRGSAQLSEQLQVVGCLPISWRGAEVGLPLGRAVREEQIRPNVADAPRPWWQQRRQRRLRRRRARGHRRAWRPPAGSFIACDKEQREAHAGSAPRKRRVGVQSRGGAGFGWLLQTGTTQKRLWAMRRRRIDQRKLGLTFWIWRAGGAGGTQCPQRAAAAAALINAALLADSSFRYRPPRGSLGLRKNQHKGR